MKGLIVSGGYVEDGFVLEYIKKESYDFTIAADSGMDFFYRNKRQPDYIVGDFDSAQIAARVFFEQENKKGRGPQIITLNPKKDDTDTQHALQMAFHMNCDVVHMFGATGSRLDHVLGNLQLLGYGLQRGVECMILDSHNRIRLINKETVLTKQGKFGQYVSLIPYTPQVVGLTLEGFLYPLKNHTMGCFYREDAAPISGISNEITADVARITLQEGILVLVESRD